MSTLFSSQKSPRLKSIRLYRQRQKILRDLTTALAAAAAKLAQSATGESAFLTPDDRKTAIDLLKLLPHLLAILPDKQPPKPVKEEDRHFVFRDRPTHCPICLETSPSHWPENCGENPLNNPLCPICNVRHFIFKCPNFKGTLQEQQEIMLQQENSYDRTLMRYTV